MGFELSILLANVEQCIGFEQFQEANSQLNTVLDTINEASLADCERILKLVHPIAKAFISQHSKGGADELYSARSIIVILENPEVSDQTKIEFYQAAAAAYKEYKDFLQVLDVILIYYNKALSLAEKNGLSREINVINQCLEQTLICAWYYYASPLIEGQIEQSNDANIRRLANALSVYKKTKLLEIKFQIDWLQRKEQLAVIREKVSGSLTEDFIKAQRNYTKDIKAFINKLSANCVEMLGKAPCGFTLLGIGSIARDEMSMYSDLDCALLIADQTYREHVYFQNYVKLLKVHLDLLGEQQQIAPGLRIDSADLAHFENLAFVDTAAGYIARYNPANLDPSLLEAYAVHRPVEVYASEEGEGLLQEYCELLANATDAKALGRAYLEVHQQQYQGLISYWAKENKVDIKDRYIRYMSLWLTDIALYFGIDKLEPLAILGELAKQQIITADFIQKYQTAYVELHQLRWKLQQASGWQDDSLADEGQIKYLTELDTKVVQIAYKSTSRLLERLAGEEINPAQVVLEQLLAEEANKLHASSYHLFYQCLLQVKDFQKAQSYCQELSINLADMETRASLLQVFASYKTQQAQVFKAIVERTPERDGSRECIEQEKQRLVDALWDLTTTDVTRQALTVVDITTQGRYERYLEPEIANQLIEKGEFKPKPKDQGGRHVVLLIIKNNNKLWCKLYPEQPGNCYAWEQLSWRLVGAGTVMSTMVKLKLKDKVAAIQVIQDIGEGELLSKVLKDNPEKLASLSHKSFTQQFIRVLILNPEDDKADDYYLVKNVAGEYELLRIDNDRALFDAEEKGKWKDWSYNKLLVKSIIFCLDQMSKPLDELVIKDFLELNPYLLLKSWLEDLQKLHSVYYGLFTEESFSEHFQKQDPGNSLLTVMIPKVQIQSLNNRIIQLQQAFKTMGCPTGRDILQNIQSVLSGYYLKKFVEYPITARNNEYALTRFLKLTENLYGIKKQGIYGHIQTHIGSTEAFSKTVKLGRFKEQNALEVWRGRANSPRQCLVLIQSTNLQTKESLGQIKLDILKGRYQGFINLAASLRSKLLKDLGHEVTSYGKKEQKNILGAIARGSFQLIQLSAYKVVLKDKQLKDIIKGCADQLLELDITGCEQITEKSINELGIYCSQLRQLHASSLVGLERVGKESLSLNFEKLELLELRDNPMLETINIRSPELKSLDVNGCTKLEAIQTNSKELECLDISYCKKLRNADLSEIEEMYFAKIKQIKLAGCEGIKYIDFIEKYPGLYKLPNKLQELGIGVTSEYLLKLLEILKIYEQQEGEGWSVEVNEPSIELTQKLLAKSQNILIGLGYIIKASQGQEQVCEKLLEVVKSSKLDERRSILASNAITLLNYAGYSFSGRDLTGIRIAGADLQEAELEGVNLRGADLTGVRLAHASLRNSDLREAKLSGVVFGERAYLREMNNGLNNVVYLPDGSEFVPPTLGRRKNFFDIFNRRELWTLGRDADNVTSVAYSRDGTTLASGSDDGTVKLWEDSSGRELQTLRGHTSTVLIVTYSPNGLKLATGGVDKTARLWDVLSGRELWILRGHTNSVMSIAFSPDEATLATGSGDGTVRLWEVASGRELKTLHKEAGEWVTKLKYSADGLTLVSRSVGGKVRSWDAKTFEQTKKKIGAEGEASKDYRLELKGANFKDATGFSGWDEDLLKQRGAKNVPKGIRSENPQWPKYDPAAMEAEIKASLAFFQPAPAGKELSKGNKRLFKF